jgi:hypothetical protein
MKKLDGGAQRTTFCEPSGFQLPLLIVIVILILILIVISGSSSPQSTGDGARTRSRDGYATLVPLIS